MRSIPRYYAIDRRYKENETETENCSQAIDRTIRAIDRTIHMNSSNVAKQKNILKLNVCLTKMKSN